MYWKSLRVDAFLDRDGQLHIKETHTIVFTGDWNGGERTFRVGSKQHLEFHQLKRYNPSTQEFSLLHQGDLQAIDQYKWYRGNILRWRSRLPSDPRFQNSQFVYQLNYTFSNILTLKDNQYLLNHDFAFPDRQWPINAFSLKLRIDPNWQNRNSDNSELEFSAGPLQPGRGYVVTIPLNYIGSGKPLSVDVPSSESERIAVVSITVILIIIFSISFYRHEKHHGRYLDFFSISEIDHDWLKSRVFTMLPEIVGAAWDETTGPSEVAAVLARMVLEGKINSKVRKARWLFFHWPVLHLELLVPKNKLKGYERKLVDHLFIEGNITDTDKIRKHYMNKHVDFIPANIIRGPLKTLVNRVIRKKSLVRRGMIVKTALVLIPTIALLVGAGYFNNEGLEVVIFLFVSVFLIIFSIVRATSYSKAFGYMFFKTLYYFSFAILYVLCTLIFILLIDVKMSLLLTIAMAGSALGFWYIFLEFQRTKYPLERFVLRRNLASARRYFIHELQSQRPNLHDDWYPYLLALDLGKNIDKWFGRFPNNYSREDSNFDDDRSSFSGRGASWSGGGGSFGGAGASASWAMAAGSIAAGVSDSNDDSGGGSSDSGGGGSSGGGGGGGW